MKTCRMMFYSDYVTEKELKLALQNTSLLDKCFVGFYDRTWSGREMEPINIDLLKNIQDISPNAEVIWIFEDEVQSFTPNNPLINEAICRNIILDKAKKEQFDFLLIQDTDEFVHEEDWDFLLNHYFPDMILGGYDTCAIRWKNFWKSWNNFLVCEEIIVPGWPGEWATFGVNLTNPIRFETGRHIEYANKCAIQQDAFLYHGSWVLTDEQVQKKISSWGHSKDIDYEKWYNDKWLNWNQETTDLHPSINPHTWKKAVPYMGKLPKECK